MRFSVSLLALMIAVPAMADDFLVRADVAEAVVYADRADVIRRVELDLPAGAHRVLFPGDAYNAPVVTASDGVVLGGVQPLRDVTVDESALSSPQEDAARAALEAAEDAVTEAEDALQAANAAIRAAELQQAYLQSIVRGGEAGVAMPADAAALAAVIAGLGEQMQRAQEAQHQAAQTRRALQDTLADRQEELAAAERALADLQPFEEALDLWGVSVTVDQAGPVVLEISESAYAAWQPQYDIHLDSDTGEMVLDRQVWLEIDSALPWRDVAVTLSTADPGRGRAPSPVWPARAVIRDEAPIARLEAQSGMAADAMVLAPMVEPVVIVEESAIGVRVDGLSLTYALADPVTIGPDGAVILPFGEIELQADLINRAVPRRDATAFLVADTENTSGEPILPGEARFFRDGDLIGEGFLEFLAAGDEVELPFGPLDHIQLDWTDLSRDTGDRGVFVSSNTEARRVLVTARNTSDGPVDLELLYATPFSEQEDLEIEVTTSAAPDVTDWQDLRGVHAWSLSLGAGQEAAISMGFQFEWPEGQVLNWHP